MHAVEPLVGREATCAVIDAVFAENPPNSVVITGRAGVGRTRLAREVVARAARRGRPTRWVTATRASSQVPLGAFVHLLPRIDGPIDPLPLLQQAAQVLAGDGNGPAPVIAVDDADLLDPLSVGLLHQLAVARAGTLVVTVRSGGSRTDPTAPLWKDGLAARVELEPLNREDTERLVGMRLGGDVEARTGEELWQLTQGNPLFLRELIDEGRRSHRLSTAEGFWRWHGPMTPSGRLTEIVLGQLGELDTEQWRALEALATAEPMDIDRLAEFSNPEAVAELERRGIVAAGGGSPGDLRTAHPMVSAVLRSRVPDAVQRLVRRRLADGQVDPAAGEQLVRRCLALLDSGAAAPDAALLTAGAGRALAAVDLPLAQRLARAGIDAGGGVQAYLVLIEASRWLETTGNIDELAEEASGAASTDDDRARLAAARAMTLACGHGRADDAAGVLAEAAAAIPPGPARAHLSAADSVLAFLLADPQRAVHQATDLLATLPDGAPARPLALAAQAVGWALTGQTSRALAAAEEGRRAVESGWRLTEALLAQVLLAHAEIQALHLAGRLDDMGHLVADLHRRALSVPEWAGDAVATLHCGWAALARGRWRQAIRWLVEAHTRLQRQDPAGLRPLCAAALATGRALVGDPGGVRQLLEDAEDGAGFPPMFRPHSMLARACGTAAEGRTRDAARLALEGADLAAGQGQLGIQAVLLHHAVRFGRAGTVAPLLEGLAERVDAALIRELAAHARAAAVGDGARLAEVSYRLEDCGSLLYAADAALEAAAVHERTGTRRAAAECRTRAMALARECGLSDTPALDALTFPTLTSREEEIASLASSGLSNQEIADRLVLSVRTVEAHLSHAYTKFGITSRAELVAALAGLPAPRTPPPGG